MKKIIVVTGANRGIGKEISKQLCALGHHVILAARNQSAGQKVEEEFTDKGYSCEYRHLDLQDAQSIHDFSKELFEAYDHLDVLINNAAVFFKEDEDSLKVNMKILRRTMEINCFGAIDLTRTLLNLLKGSSEGRVINMSSGLGAMNEMAGGRMGYRISKVAINAFTKILAADLSDTNIKVNSMGPGWVRTDMGGSEAPRSIEQGAETAVWLATEERIGNGKFYRDKKEIEW